MLKEILKIWPLFLGVLIIGMVTGSQGSLLGIRATNENFGGLWLSAIMTAYFAGILIGSLICPRLIRQVGHVRTFAVLTAVTSMVILVYPIIVDPLLWTVIRFITGLSIAGIVIVAETWLNRASNNENRGQMLSIYMVFYTSGMIAGQFLLNLGNPNSHELFILISILVSFAAIPMLTSSVPTPPVEIFERMKIHRLWKWTPYGVAGAFLINLTLGVMMGMGAVFATKSGLDVFHVSLFMCALLLGNAISQWPIGKLSDLFDRRIVICVVAWIGCGMAILASQYDINSSRGLLTAGLVGAFCLPLYALFIALTNDHMKPEKIIPASGALVLIGGCGIVSGPLLATWSMEKFGIDSYFILIAIIMGIIAVYGTYRSIFKPYVPKEQQHEFSIYAPTTLGANLRVNDEND